MSRAKAKAKPRKEDQTRAQNKTRRILTLIDTLAPLRMPFSLLDVVRLVEDKHGSRIDVHKRTIQRDLELLVLMNFVEIARKATRVEPQLYRMNLRTTEQAQKVAVKAVDEVLA